MQGNKKQRSEGNSRDPGHPARYEGFRNKGKKELKGSPGGGIVQFSVIESERARILALFCISANAKTSLVK